MAKVRLDGLTGIRGFAALWVLLHHLVTQYPIIGMVPPWLEIIANKGWLGVDLFFILSGFVISYVHQNDFREALNLKAYKRFLVLRFARVYPVHIVTTLMLVPIYLVASSLFSYSSNLDAFSLEKLFHAITLTNGLGISSSVGWNAPSWSVSAECFVYLLFPFATYLVFSKKMKISTCLLICFAILLTTIALSHWINDAKQYMLPWSWTMLRVGAEFSLGCLLYNMFKQGTLPAPSASLSILCLCILIGLNMDSYYDFLFIIVFMLLIWGLCCQSSITTTLLSTKAMVYLGNISYSIYLSHSLVFMVLSAIAKRLLPADNEIISFVSALVYVGTTLIVSHILYFVLETKARDYIKNRFT